MKNVFFISMILMLQSCVAQKDTTKPVMQKVFVKDWAEVAYFLPAGFWNETKTKEIVSKIGADQFEKVKIYADLKMIPCQFLIFCGSGKKKPIPELRAKLEKLTAYELTSFHNINSNGIDHGEMSIIMVPYKGNENWDPEATWDTIYFLVNKNLVNPIQ